MTHFPPAPELHEPEEAAAMSPETCLLQLSVSKQSPAVSSGGHLAGILAASRIWAAEATCLAGTEWFLETGFLRVRKHALGDATAPPSLREPPPSLREPPFSRGLKYFSNVFFIFIVLMLILKPPVWFCSDV